MTRPEKRRIRAYIEKFLKVEAKVPDSLTGNKIVPFKLNEAQAALDEAAESSKWHLVPKARQLGISTYIEARFLVACLTIPGTHAAIVSHEADATKRLLRRVKFFLKQMEEDGILKVPLDYDSTKEMVFPETNSSLYIGTAGQKAFSRGDSLTHFHGSEVAFWPDAGKLMQGVIGALTPNAEVFLESSANGMGGYFYDVVNKADEAEKGIGESPFKLHFFPWNMAKEYRRNASEGVLWSPEEQFLARTYGLDQEQLAWRRWKLSSYHSIEEFQQEFPLSLEEAFIVSGTCYFDKMALRMFQRQVKEPVAVGIVEELGERSQFNRLDSGTLRIWEFPISRVEYLITVDCSEGIDAADTDSTCAQVINRERFAQAAVLHGKLDPIETAERLYALGHYYKWPWIAIEDNGPGLACLLKLKEMGYPKMYRHRRLDLDTQAETEKLGWHTDQKTRPLILSTLKQCVKQQSFKIMDKETLKEHTTFCRQSDGRYSANTGCHDDRVMALAIGVYLHGLLPYRPDQDDERDSRNSIGDRQVFTKGHKTGY